MSGALFCQQNSYVLEIMEMFLEFFIQNVHTCGVLQTKRVIDYLKNNKV